MKKILSLIIALGTVAAVHAQGTFNGNTSNSDPNGTGAGGSIYDGSINDATTPTGKAYASGSGYHAQYYAALQSGGAQSAQGSVGPIGTGATIGYFMPGTVTTSFAAGTPVTVQLKAWKGSATSYENAVAASALTGVSGFINLTLNPSTTPGPNITTMGNIILTVPEPATLALGLMGAGALFIRRRK